jgi:hypothetical protein
MMHIVDDPVKHQRVARLLPDIPTAPVTHPRHSGMIEVAEFGVHH